MNNETSRFTRHSSERPSGFESSKSAADLKHIEAKRRLSITRRLKEMIWKRSTRNSPCQGRKPKFSEKWNGGKEPLISIRWRRVSCLGHTLHSPFKAIMIVATLPLHYQIRRIQIYVHHEKYGKFYRKYDKFHRESTRFMTQKVKDSQP